MSLSAAPQQSEPRTSSYGQTNSEASTIVLSQQDSLLSTMATHQPPPPLSNVVGGHKRNSSLQADHHEVYVVTHMASLLLSLFSLADLVLNQALSCQEDHMI